MQYEQLTLFNLTNGKYRIDKHIRLIELFGGIGSQAMALRDIGADFETYKLVEFDKNAVNSYNAIHHTDFIPADITKTHASDLEICDTDKYEYIMTYSFPCQDLSLAGKQKGMEKGSGTRSGLLWEVERILKECEELPQVLLMENVPQVHVEKNIDDFNSWIEFLHNLGYYNYYEDLNAKDYGIPQNRERCFMLSILGNYEFNFPERIKLNRNIKSILEDKVDNKFYLKNNQLNKLILTKKNNRGEIGYIKKTEEGKKHQSNTVYSDNCICRTLTAVDYKSPVMIRQATKEGYIKCNIGGVADLSYPESKTRRGRVINDGNVSPTLMTGESDICRIENPYRIRKLTPLECWRLMGFSDQDFHNAEKVNSNTQLYKQAGNSIVKNVLMAIFRNLNIKDVRTWDEENSVLSVVDG